MWSDPLGPEDGAEVFMPDVIAAGATLQPSDTAGEFGVIAMQTQTVDSLVRSGAIPRVDFLKVDVEGADVGHRVACPPR